eukprot:CAMPEP_0178430326 /NCGR_PEP_ID=MMETSP0689_2-20121128/31263_1 /TAXON_ID=160604 /ORGANISM="Amphidinium massartii, Strain CS-259" /LENGTH=373 /DNA_ID=CAMNT_0020052181 /DNA_START=141 /DNA_END=1258 /DNA_ORIENTATION=-
MPSVLVQQQWIGDELNGACRLRAVTLNILADSYARGCEDASHRLRPVSPLFTHHGVGGVAMRPGVVSSQDDYFRLGCSAENLEWERRWAILRGILIDLDPDLIGLQEIDLLDEPRHNARRHDGQIRKDLDSAGYEGVFARKGGRAFDGVGIFWRRTRLRKFEPKIVWPLGASVMVALAQKLILDGAHVFTAVSTHLKAGFTAESEHVRELQAAVLLDKLKHHENVVLMADLNSHCAKLYASADHTGSVAPRPVVYNLLLRSMQSSYRAVLGREPSFTVWSGWMDREVRLVCDYIFLKGPLFTAGRVLKLPDEKDIVAFPERLPNTVHPSDHLPLAADLFVAQGDQARWQGLPWVAAARLTAKRISHSLVLEKL